MMLGLFDPPAQGDANGDEEVPLAIYARRKLAGEDDRAILSAYLTQIAAETQKPIASARIWLREQGLWSGQGQPSADEVFTGVLRAYSILSRFPRPMCPVCAIPRFSIASGGKPGRSRARGRRGSAA